MGNSQSSPGHCRHALIVIGLLVAGLVLPLESRADGSSAPSRDYPVGSPGSRGSRSEPGSKVISVKPTPGKGVKMRVLTKDGRVRDLVVDENKKP